MADEKRNFRYTASNRKSVSFYRVLETPLSTCMSYYNINRNVFPRAHYITLIYHIPVMNCGCLELFSVTDDYRMTGVECETGKRSGKVCMTQSIYMLFNVPIE